MTIVVDASVAVRWFLDVAGSEQAYRLIGEADCLIAPDLVMAELANALWKAVQHAGLAASIAADAIAHAAAGFHELVPAQELAGRALAIAIELRHPVYDCIYIALAEARAARLVTADAKLLRACVRTRYASLVRSL
jgi:predicted nucleic acid-binding protein